MDKQFLFHNLALLMIILKFPFSATLKDLLARIKKRMLFLKSKTVQFMVALGVLERKNFFIAQPWWETLNFSHSLNLSSTPNFGKQLL